MAWQNQQNGCAPSEDSDQAGHPPSLIRVFTVRMKKAWVLSYPLSAQRRLWSDWADAQVDLSLRWAHTHFVGFVVSRLKLITPDSRLQGTLRNKISTYTGSCNLYSFFFFFFFFFRNVTNNLRYSVTKTLKIHSFRRNMCYPKVIDSYIVHVPLKYIQSFPKGKTAAGYTETHDFFK